MNPESNEAGLECARKTEGSCAGRVRPYAAADEWGEPIPGVEPEALCHVHAVAEPARC